MVNHDDFWSRKQSAAVLKHAVLGNYLSPFVAMTASERSNYRAWYVDAYAGPGEYAPEDGEKVGQPGSPLVALGTARSLAEKTPSRDLQCVFIEQDPAHAQTLSAVVQRSAARGKAHVIQGAAQNEMPGVITAMGTDPALTFLDPYGTALPYPLMRDVILGRDAKVNEVLLNLNITTLWRIGGILGSDRKLTAADQKTVDLLDVFLGESSWRDVFLSTFQRGVPGSAATAALAVAEHFRDCVKRDTGYESFAIDVRKAPGHAPIFQLTLFYRSGYAAYKFADAASHGHEQWREFNMRTEARKNGVLFADALLAEDFSEESFAAEFKTAEGKLHLDLVRTIEANIRELMRTRTRVALNSDADIKAVYGEALGIGREKHLRAAWDSLAGQGVVQPRVKSAKMHHARIERLGNTPALR